MDFRKLETILFVLGVMLAVSDAGGWYSHPGWYKDSRTHWRLEYPKMKYHGRWNTDGHRPSTSSFGPSDSGLKDSGRSNQSPSNNFGQPDSRRIDSGVANAVGQDTPSVAGASGTRGFSIRNNNRISPGVSQTTPGGMSWNIGDTVQPTSIPQQPSWDSGQVQRPADPSLRNPSVTWGNLPGGDWGPGGGQMNINQMTPDGMVWNVRDMTPPRNNQMPPGGMAWNIGAGNLPAPPSWDSGQAQ